MNNNILITGSSGLLGSNLVNFFLSKGFKVYSFDQNKNSIKHKNHFFFRSSIKNFFKKTNNFNYKTIIHTAALSKNFFAYQYPEETLSKNISNLLEILKYLKKKKKKIKFIFMSSNQIDSDNKLFGHLHPYALSKKTCEEILKFYSSYYRITIVNIRLFDVYTSTEKNKPLFMNLIKKLKKNKKIYVKNDYNLKLLHISEISNLVLRILKRNHLKFFTNYNFLVKSKVSLFKLVSFFKKKLKSKSKISFLKKDFTNNYDQLNSFKLIKPQKKYLSELNNIFKTK